MNGCMLDLCENGINTALKDGDTVAICTNWLEGLLSKVYFLRDSPSLISELYEAHETWNRTMRKGQKIMAEQSMKTRNTAGVFMLKDLAAYQEHSVVSREIIQKPSCTMTIFAFDKGEGLQ